MPGDNFSRRVARAAASGGGRTYRAQTPVTWYLVLLVICLLGVSLVAYSRYELIHPPVAATKPVVPPTASNEWEAAVAVDVCGQFVPSALPVDDVADDPLASIGDGVVRIEPGISPQAAEYEGKNATLGAYLLIEGVGISSNLLEIPGKPVPVPTTTTTTTTVAKGKKAKGTTTTSTSSTTSTTVAKGKKAKGTTTTTSTSSTTTTTTVLTKPGPARDYKNGVTKCGSQPGYIEVETWPSPTATKGTVVPASQADGVRLADGQLITIAFLPKGEALPQPPAADRNAVQSFMIADPSGVSAGAPTSTSATTSTSTSSTSTTVAKKKGTSTSTSSSSTTSSTSASTTSSTS